MLVALIVTSESFWLNNVSCENVKSGNVNSKNKKLAEEEAGEQVAPQIIKTAQIINTPKTQAVAMEALTVEDRTDYKLPSFDLLDDNKTEVDSGNIEVNVTIIKKTLADFGINVEMGEVNVGPTVTQYTLAPAPGVKLSRLAELQNNLAPSEARAGFLRPWGYRVSSRGCRCRPLVTQALSA